MPTVNVELPPTIYEQKLCIMVDNLSDLFLKLNSHNIIKNKMLFLASDTMIKPKPFISVFVNDLLTFDYSKALNEGDQVILSMAIAGG